LICKLNDIVKQTFELVLMNCVLLKRAKFLSESSKMNNVNLN